ncbi:TPA: GDP-L-fucose synthase family protein [Campylobacter jejuni]
MHKDSKIYIAGHRGLVGSAILSKLKQQGYNNLIFKTHDEINLINQKAVGDFFKKEKPEYVFFTAAKVGGIASHMIHRADFIYENLMMECNIIHNAYLHGIKKLLFIASTSVYPKDSLLPIDEKQMLTGDLEYSTKPYAIAKISGLMLCESYNLQYDTNFIAITPTNLYGNHDNFDLGKSHVLPGILRKIHLAKLLSEERYKDLTRDLKLNSIDKVKKYLRRFGISRNCVEIWGSGKPTRELLHSQDLADACVFIMNNIDFKDLKGDSIEIANTHLNVGPNENITIRDLAELVKNIVGFKGELKFNINYPDGVMQRLTDCSRIHSLGWKHKINLKEGIEMVYEWYKKHNNEIKNDKNLNDAREIYRGGG